MHEQFLNRNWKQIGNWQTGKCQFSYKAVSKHFVEIIYSVVAIKSEVLSKSLNEFAPNRSNLKYWGCLYWICFYQYFEVCWRVLIFHLEDWVNEKASE